MDASGHGNSEYERANTLSLYSADGKSLCAYTNPKFKENTGSKRKKEYVSSRLSVSTRTRTDTREMSAE